MEHPGRGRAQRWPRPPARSLRCLGAGLCLALALLAPRPGFSVTDNIEIGLHYDWGFSQFDLAHMDPGPSYGLLGHYWLTDVTSIDVAFDWFTSTWGVKVDRSAENLDFQMWLLSAGIRYEPEVDFFLAPYAGAGLGYQQWNTRSSIDGVDNRKGSGLAYYALLGAEYRITPRLAVGPWARMVLVPFQTKMEQEVVAGRTTDKTHLNQGALILTGLEFTFRIR